MSVCDLTVNVGTQPLDPATHLPLMEMVYSNNVLEEKFQTAGALNFFQPEVDDRWKNELAIHQSIRVRFKDYRNPFNNVGVSEITYDEAQTCPPVMDDQCDPGCVSSENSWRYEDVLFKNKFRVGVSWCVESEKLLYQDAESRFNESVEDGRKVQAAVGWSELICQAIATPATTLLPRFAAIFPTHYYDAGTADPYDTMTLVMNYMQRVYGARWSSEFMILADPGFELEILSRQSNIHNYDSTGIETTNGNVGTFVAGGFRPMAALPRLWGKPVMIAPDVVDYYPASGDLSGDNLNPFQNSDGTKYYVVIVSKRAFFQGAVTLMDKKYFPATCNNKNDAIQQTWLSFYKILFPKEIFVVAFTAAIE